MATLPVEILIAIVDHLANIADGMKSSLSVLLCVSRQFYAITLPRLYQEIIWPPSDENALAAFEKFHDTAKTNPGIRFITSYKFFITPTYSFDHYPREPFAHVLPCLANVRRLALNLAYCRIIDLRLLCSLPPTAQLTHLTIVGPLDWDDFLQFTTSCPTLEYLHIPEEQTGQTALTNSQLPNLQSLVSHTENLFLFEDLHSLENLSSTGLWTAKTVEHVVRSFPSLRTLSMQAALRHAAITLIPQYPNLDYLALGMGSVPETLDTTWLSRSKLRYIHFSETHDPNPEVTSHRIFNAVKSLVFFQCFSFRMYKDGSTSPVDLFKQNYDWTGWWEAVQRDIERADRG